MARERVIIIDCQLLQTKAWHRGMGKYTARVLEAWTQDKGLARRTPRILLLFNEVLPFSNELADFTKSLPGSELVFLRLGVPNYDDTRTVSLEQQRNVAILDEYLAQNHPGSHVSFLITSLFLDEACPVFPTRAHQKSIIYYDLIPLMYVKKYLGYGASEQFFTRFSVLYQSDVVFAISETVANDLTTFLGFPGEKIVNIYGASNQSPDKRRAARPDCAIDRPFILMPTGGDPRKNNEQGVRAFALFNERQQNKYQLVLTSYFNDEQKRDLTAICDSIVFSGNVSDDELWWLYQHSEGVLFPSEYEGLGMPVLEAIDAGKSVACSDIQVFREISTDAFFMFSPYSIDECVFALEAMLGDAEAVTAKKRFYKHIQQTYTWRHTAEVIVSELLRRELQPQRKHKPRVAIVCPHICQPTEVGLWATNQYSSIAHDYDIDYYYESAPETPIVRPSHAAFVTNTYSIFELTEERYHTYDTVIYVYDSAAFSRFTLLAAMALPGVLVVGNTDTREAVEGLASEGYIRRSDIPAHKEVLSRSLLTLATADINNVRRRFMPTMPTLPYEIKPHIPVSNKIIIPLAGADPTEWGGAVQLICAIRASAIGGEVEICLAMQRKADSALEKVTDKYNISLRDDLTDHELFSLTMRSDLCVIIGEKKSLHSQLVKLRAHSFGLSVVFGSEQNPQQTVLDITKWVKSGSIIQSSDSQGSSYDLRMVIDEALKQKKG